MTLARPLKAGMEEVLSEEFWVGPVIPALRGRAKFSRRSATKTKQARSRFKPWRDGFSRFALIAGGTPAVPAVRLSDELGSLKARVLLDEFLLAEAGKGDCQLQRIADAFAAQDETAAVLGVADVGAGDKISRATRGRGHG